MMPQMPIMGSADPHRVGDMPRERRPRAIKSSSFRALEPELPSVLRSRLLPRVHIPPRTEWFTPSDEPPTEPGFQPQHIDEVVTSAFKAAFDAVARETKAAHDAALRGRINVAKGLRPKARCLTENQALRPQARGDRWDLTACEHGGAPVRLRPSRYPDRPPDTQLNIEAVLRAAGANGATDSRFGVTYDDQEMIAWCAHGFDSLSLADRSLTVLFAQHVGALMHMQMIDETIQKGRDKGFLQGPFRHTPPFAPCWCLPYGCVVQKGKARMTIDPSIALIDGVAPVNDIDTERALIVRWLRTSEFCEGIAILQTSGMPVALASIDGESYYRVLGTQVMDHPLFCLMSHQGVDRDLRVNFGPRHAPSAATRHSHFIVWVCNHEMCKFNEAHPPTDPRLKAFVEERRTLIEQLDEHDHRGLDVRAVVLHMLVMFVDDAGLAVIDDVLHTPDGGVWMNEEPQRAIPMTRGAMLFTILRRCFHELGHSSAIPKEHPPWLTPGRMVYTGTLIIASARRRETAPEKRDKYAELCRQMLKSKQRVEWAALNSLWHKLLHAAECTPGGRQHLFALQRVVRAQFRLRARAVVLGREACAELEWWVRQLSAEHQEGVPLAPRQQFESALSTCCLCFYGDASREFQPAGDPDLIKSGFGAWTIRLMGEPPQPKMLFVEGRWLPIECVEMHIGAMEFKLQNIALMTLYEAAGGEGVITHALEFSDNVGSEGATDTGSSSAEVFQRLIAERTEFILERGIFTHSERITSKANVWADKLSRGLVDEVVAEATTLGLAPERVPIEPEVRSTEAARQRDAHEPSAGYTPPWASVGVVGDGKPNAVVVQRNTPLGNPFHMRGEYQRNAVCDAYEHVLRDGPAAPLCKIAKQHGVSLLEEAEAANAMERTKAVLQLVRRVLRGDKLHLQCCCAPKRCHAEALARCVNRLAHAPREREAWSQWTVDAAAWF